ncbi:MAG: M67 family metallopeptidase [Dehalococcoidia bacterium]
MFRLQRRHAEEIVAHAREAAPNECCGILAGKNGRALKLSRAVNAEESPYRYNIETQDLYRIHSEARAKGWEFVAIYHSHPDAEAYPSETDVALARWPGGDVYVDAWPGVRYLIVSLADAQSPVIRAFRIEEGRVSEESLQVVD